MSSYIYQDISLEHFRSLQRPSQSPDLNLIEMLWHDLKRAIHSSHPKNIAELKEFCKKEHSKFLLTDSQVWSATTGNSWLMLMLPTEVQPEIKFKGSIKTYNGLWTEPDCVCWDDNNNIFCDWLMQKSKSFQVVHLLFLYIYKNTWINKYIVVNTTSA